MKAEAVEVSHRQQGGGQDTLKTGHGVEVMGSQKPNLSPMVSATQQGLPTAEVGLL